MNIRPIETAEDIVANTVYGPRFVSDADTDRQQATIYVPYDVASVERLSKLPAPNHTMVHRASMKNDEWFCGTKDYNHMITLLRDGWPEGLKQVEGIIKRLGLTVQAQKRRPVYRPSVAPVGGVTLNFGDLASGGPSPFIGKYHGTDTTKGQKMMRLAFNCATSSSVDQKIIMARGAVVTALVKQLERNGISCSIDVIFNVSNYTKNTNLASVWRVKNAGQELPLGKVVFALAHPSTQRRLSFAVYEHAPAGYGNQMGYGSVAAIVGSRMAQNYDIIVDSETAHDSELWTNPVRQERWIKDQLAVLGVKCF